MRVNWHLWSGVYRAGERWRDGAIAAYTAYPTVIIDVNLNDWALPLSVHVGGPLLGRPGLTFRVGPVNIGWSRL